MAHSENFSSDTRHQVAPEREPRSAEYCEQRFTQQHQGEDRENSIFKTSHLHLSAGDQVKSRDSREVSYNSNSHRHKILASPSAGNETTSFKKGQDTVSNNAFDYRS